jgi:hypothetical protein
VRIVITIEDTEKGVRVGTEWGSNGVTDNMLQSLAMNFAASLALNIRKLTKENALVLEELNPPNYRRGLPRL